MTLRPAPNLPAPLKAIFDVPAPAKLNLFLHVTGRRNDGLHLIQSAFMLIDWCDTLHFELRRDGKIRRHDSAAEGTEALPVLDLTLRAAHALQQACGTSLGADITLEKHIPTQAGMGGGSSDAASCLLALQRLWGVALPRAQLLSLALLLGADVPFFLCGGHAWVEGVGELITPITLPTAGFVVLKPPEGLSTHAIFEAPELRRDTDTATIQGFAANAGGRIFGFGRNDLQPVAQGLCPQVGKSLDWLAARGLSGRMTGSGSAVFAHVPHDMKADLTGGDLTGWRVRQCSNLNTHPLAGW